MHSPNLVAGTKLLLTAILLIHHDDDVMPGFLMKGLPTGLFLGQMLSSIQPGNHSQTMQSFIGTRVAAFEARIHSSLH